MSLELWSVYAHDEGVYSVDLNEAHVASGGEEGGVRVWGRADGALLSTLCHHNYIVWNVSFWLDRLFTCSYDCTVAYLSPRAAKGEEEEGLFVVRRRIKGPLWWADAFCADRQGRYLSTHDDNTFGVGRELLLFKEPLRVATQGVKRHSKIKGIGKRQECSFYIEIRDVPWVFVKELTSEQTEIPCSGR